MDEKMLEIMVTSFTNSLLEESEKILSTMYNKGSDEIKQFIGTDIKNYLTKQKENYSHVKTLLRGNTPTFLYEIYYPLKLKSGKKIISTDSISNIFDDNNYITIIGDAGSGKSTLIKHLFLNSISEKYKIPLLIELRYLNNNSVDLEEYVKKIIDKNKISVNLDIMERYLSKGKFVFFLDGYDELDSKTKESATKQLNEFIKKYDKNNYILTSRPYSDIEHFPLFHNLYMKDLSLTDGEIKGFIYKQLNSEKELADKIIKSIEQGKLKYIKSFLKNPLLLTLYILTFQSYASIPDKKYIFYRRVINALFSEHDSKTKLGFVREKLCGLNQEEFENILKVFSFISYFDGRISFDYDYVTSTLKTIKSKYKNINFDNNKFIVDLKSSIALWVEDNGVMSFAHRSLQEYFAALFIKELQSEANEKVYNKIKNEIGAVINYNNLIRRREIGAGIQELDNLLNLLFEMDEFNYHKNYYLPNLFYIKNYFDLHSSKPMQRQLIDLLIFRIVISDRRLIEGKVVKSHTILGVRLDYKHNYYPIGTIMYSNILNNKYIWKLTKYIEKIIALQKDEVFAKEIVSRERLLHESIFGERVLDKENNIHVNCYIDLKDGISDELYSILDSEELLEITNGYYAFLENEIERVNNFLNEKVENENNIVNLI